jgi:hypothetical protein
VVAQLGARDRAVGAGDLLDQQIFVVDLQRDGDAAAGEAVGEPLARPRDVLQERVEPHLLSCEFRQLRRWRAPDALG